MAVTVPPDALPPPDADPVDRDPPPAGDLPAAEPLDMRLGWTPSHWSTRARVIRDALVEESLDDKLASLRPRTVRLTATDRDRLLAAVTEAVRTAQRYERWAPVVRRMIGNVLFGLLLLVTLAAIFAGPLLPWWQYVAVVALVGVVGTMVWAWVFGDRDSSRRRELLRGALVLAVTWSALLLPGWLGVASWLAGGLWHRAAQGMAWGVAALFTADWLDRAAYRLTERLIWSAKERRAPEAAFVDNLAWLLREVDWQAGLAGGSAASDGTSPLVESGWYAEQLDYLARPFVQHWPVAGRPSARTSAVRTEFACRVVASLRRVQAEMLLGHRSLRYLAEGIFDVLLGFVLRESAAFQAEPSPEATRPPLRQLLLDLGRAGFAVVVGIGLFVLALRDDMVPKELQVPLGGAGVTLAISAVTRWLTPETRAGQGSDEGREKLPGRFGHGRP